MMDDGILITLDEDFRPNEPVFIEGLPGIGNVGKIAADYIVEKLEAKEVGRIYFEHFPPQVLLDDDNVIDMVHVSFNYIRIKDRDIIFLTGSHQASDTPGHYRFASRVVSLMKEWGVQRVYTLGGYGIGKIEDKPRVLGAVTHPHLREELEEVGVVFEKGEPANGIVGASGLLLGFAKLSGIEGACLMGETSGYLLDPKAAKEIILILQKLLGFEVPMDDIDESIESLKEITEKLSEIEHQMSMAKGEKKQDLNYIG